MYLHVISFISLFDRSWIYDGLWIFMNLHEEANINRTIKANIYSVCKVQFSKVVIFSRENNFLSIL